MPIWKGNPSNPAPNTVQEPTDRSEKFKADNDSFNHMGVGNRAEQIRRDKDAQKDFTISLYDIDETILTHLQKMNLQVVDQGKQVKVPVFFGSPEQWTSAQRDGHIRDKQGKLILPAMILKRTNSEQDASLQFFHRYLNSSVMKLYSPKNKYTQFSTLVPQNAPVNDVYNVVLPSHMVLTYHFVVWTELVEQMNPLIEQIQFNTKDYWGSRKGFRFRTKVDSYGHTVELQAGDDRVVKTEFDLVTHGYILPDQMTKLDHKEMTTKKFLTPKKIVMGVEVVSTGYDWSNADSNREKWRNPNYPNLQADVPIPAPPVTVVDTITDSSGVANEIVSALRAATINSSVTPISTSTPDASSYLRVVPTPASMATLGNEGDVSYDSNYFYIYSGGQWRRVAITDFSG